ncbi:tripartite tricarboxylate transporter substrate binding protein [Pigmentiphaga soli]|uniref:Tripartite tricarboxylate transporter substrate binding protein n=1 Tax=Pigmentiphaga soli TaxID=1007095 RepID=A0ABP8H151_9BURK
MKLLAFKAMLAAVALSAGGASFAQDYPNRPVSIISPFPPGGAADVVVRIIAQKLTENTGTSFVVDNKAGAGGAIGTDYVARAAPDGYTLVLTSSSTMSINPNLSAKTPYDPFKSFTPIVFVGYAPNVLVVNPGLKVNSVQELIAAAKAAPGKLNFGSNGVGTLSHLTIELFKRSAGIDVLHVPYKGAAPVVADTASGQVAALFTGYPSALPMLKSGKLRALGVTSTKRIALAPELPTIAESGLPGFEAIQWWGLWGPAGLPKPIVDRLNAEMNKVLSSPETKKRFAQESVELAGGTPEDLTAYLRTDYDRWAKVAKEGNIRLE